MRILKKALNLLSLTEFKRNIKKISKNIIKIYSFFISLNRIDSKYQIYFSYLLAIGGIGLLFNRLFIYYIKNLENIDLNLVNVLNYLTYFSILQFILLYIIYIFVLRSFIIFYLKKKLINNNIFLMTILIITIKSACLIKFIIFLSRNFNFEYYGFAYSFPLFVIFIILSFKISVLLLNERNFNKIIFLKLNNFKKININKLKKKIINYFLIIFILSLVLFLIINSPISINNLTVSLFFSSIFSIPIIFCDSDSEDDSDYSVPSDTAQEIDDDPELVFKSRAYIENRSIPENSPVLGLFNSFKAFLNSFNFMDLFRLTASQLAGLNNGQRSLLVLEQVYRGNMLPTFMKQYASHLLSFEEEIYSNNYLINGVLDLEAMNRDRDLYIFNINYQYPVSSPFYLLQMCNLYFTNESLYYHKKEILIQNLNHDGLNNTVKMYLDRFEFKVDINRN